MKAKIFGYILLFVVCAFLINYGAKLLLEVWWVLIIIAVLVVIIPVIYRLIKANEWR